MLEISGFLVTLWLGFSAIRQFVPSKRIERGAPATNACEKSKVLPWGSKGSLGFSLSGWASREPEAWCLCMFCIRYVWCVLRTAQLEHTLPLQRAQTQKPTRRSFCSMHCIWRFSLLPLPRMAECSGWGVSTHTCSPQIHSSVALLAHLLSLRVSTACLRKDCGWCQVSYGRRCHYCRNCYPCLHTYCL